MKAGPKSVTLREQNTRRRLNIIRNWPPHRIRDYVIRYITKAGKCDDLVVRYVMEC